MLYFSSFDYAVQKMIISVVIIMIHKYNTHVNIYYCCYIYVYNYLEENYTLIVLPISYRQRERKKNCDTHSFSFRSHLHLTHMEQVNLIIVTEKSHSGGIRLSSHSVIFVQYLNV